MAGQVVGGLGEQQSEENSKPGPTMKEYEVFEGLKVPQRVWPEEESRKTGVESGKL